METEGNELPDMSTDEMTEVVETRSEETSFLAEMLSDRFAEIDKVEQAPEMEMTEVIDPADEPEVAEVEEVEEVAEVEEVDEVEEVKSEEDDFLNDDDIFSVEEEESEESTEQPEDHIRERLKIEGQERKRLEKELATKDADIASLESKIEELQRENQRSSYHQIDPKTDPEFQDRVDRLQRQIDNALSMQDTKTGRIADNWGAYLEDMRNLEDLGSTEKREGLNNLRLRVAQDMGLVDEDATEIDPDYDPDMFNRVNRILGVFQQHTGEVDALQNLYDDIMDKSQNKALAFGYEEYNNKAQPLREKLSSLENLTERDIETDPTSLESLAAKKLKMSTEAQKKASKLDEMLTEFVYGPTALDQSALDRLKNAGKDLVELEKARMAKVEDNRLKYLPRIKSLLVLWPEISKALPEFIANQEAKMKKSESKKALSSTARPSAPTKKPVEEKISRDSMFQSLGLK